MFIILAILLLYHVSQAFALVKVCPPSQTHDTECKEEGFPWKNVQLPKYYKPTHYDLTIQPNLTTGEFDGHVTIKVTSNPKETKDASSKDWLILHVNCLTLSTIDISTMNPPKQIEDKDVQYCAAFNQLALKLPNGVGEKFSIHLVFHGVMTNDTVKGLSIGEYKSSESGDTMTKIVTTQFEAIDARKMFPCFDEPSFKATFAVTIVREKHLKSLSNVKLDESRPTEDDKTLIKDVYKTTPIMSTYLLAIAVYDSETFKSITMKSKSGVEISTYAPAYDIEKTRGVLKIADESLNFMNKFFGVPYPLDKLDFISTPNHPYGGMENWGLVTIKDDSMKLDDPSLEAFYKESRTKLIIHEVAHQWFGNLVTMEWWEDLWLNEGFARFMENYVGDKIAPEFDMMSNFLHTCIERPMVDKDSLTSAHAVSPKITDQVGLMEKFDSVAYCKGASLIRSLLSLIGIDNLESGFKDYMTTYQYSNTKEAGLWTSLNKFKTNMPSDLTVGDYMSNFTKKAGFPLIEISIEKGTLKAKQTRFYNTIDDFKNIKQDETWHVPLTIKTDKSNEVVTYWLKKEREVSIKTELNDFNWFKVNIEKNGFYRVSYDDKNWQALFNSLAEKPDILSNLDRADLLSDAFALLKLGKSSIEQIFNYLKGYLDKETSVTVWSIVSEHTKYIENRLRGSEAHAGFMRFMAKLLEKPYTTYGREDSNSKHNDHKAQLLKTSVVELACLFNASDCRKDAVQKFMNFLEKGAEIDPNIHMSSCQYAIKTYENIFDKIVEFYKNNSDKHETYMVCLASSPSHVNDLIKIFLDEKIIGEEGIMILVGIITAIREQETGLTTMWDFLDQNFEYVKKKLPESLKSYMVTLFQGFQTKDYIAKIQKRFIDETDIKDSVDQTTGIIQSNMQFMELNEDALIKYFKG